MVDWHTALLVLVFCSQQFLSNSLGLGCRVCKDNSPLSVNLQDSWFSRHWEGVHTIMMGVRCPEIQYPVEFKFSPTVDSEFKLTMYQTMDADLLLALMFPWIL